MTWKPVYVSVNEMKRYMRIDTTDTEDDEEIAEDLAAASRDVDRHCGRQFGSAAGTRRYTARYDRHECLWFVVIDDLMVVEGLTVTVDGVTLDSADYTLEPVNALAEGKPYERLTSTSALSTTRHGVAITADPWGWTTIPAGAKKATKIQANYLAARRKAPLGASGSPQMGNERRAQAVLDPDAAEAVRYLRRWWAVAA